MGSGEEQEEAQQWELDLNHSLSEFRAGCYSPTYIRLEELPLGTVTFLEEEDLARRNFDQQKALQGSKVKCVSWLMLIVFLTLVRWRTC